MKKRHRSLIIASLLALAALISACMPAPETSTGSEASDEEGIGLANPAAVYCEGLGYAMETVENESGEDADCLFPDETRCAQWDFLAGRCGQAFTYCELQGGTMVETDGNAGTCRFSDGSTCDEYGFFQGECAPGDNPAEELEAVVPTEDESVDEALEIHDFIEARDFLADYFAEQYGLDFSEAWFEEDITSEDSVGASTYRYVSGAVTLVISAEAAAPYAALYTIEEASDISNGFTWEGTLTFNGTITEETVTPPGTVLDVEQARDAVLAYLSEQYELDLPAEWSEESVSDGENASIITTYTSDAWEVKVTYLAAAPLVSEYAVTVENADENFEWEGAVTLWGKIQEVNESE